MQVRWVRSWWQLPVLLAALALALAPAAAQDTDFAPSVVVKAVLGDKAMLEVDGQSALLRKGQTLNGVKLLDVSPDGAEVEVAGKRLQVGFGASVGTTFARPEKVETRVYREAAEKFFRPELFNRIDRVIAFHELTRDQIRSLAGSLTARALDRPGVTGRRLGLTIDPGVEEALAGLMAELVTDGRTVIAVHHDLETIPEYFDHVFLLNVRAIASGPVETTFVPQNLRKAFGALVGPSPPRAAAHR